MTEKELLRLFFLMRRPIPWDPIPPWLKLGKDQVAKFHEVQERMNAKMAEIDQQKVTELEKIAGASIIG